MICLKTGVFFIKGSNKKKTGLIVPVTSDFSSSESDSEESESKPVSSAASDESDSSDSEGLENWMILGQGNQDGDQSISLNLEGTCDNSSGGPLLFVWPLFHGKWDLSLRDLVWSVSSITLKLP